MAVTVARGWYCGCAVRGRGRGRQAWGLCRGGVSAFSNDGVGGQARYIANDVVALRSPWEHTFRDVYVAGAHDALHLWYPDVVSGWREFRAAKMDAFPSTAVQVGLADERSWLGGPRQTTEWIDVHDLGLVSCEGLVAGYLSVRRRRGAVEHVDAVSHGVIPKANGCFAGRQVRPNALHD